VPIYILGSSLYGATLAAALGLPFGFASHFAPDSLEAAVATYRRNFRPSEQLAEPYVIAGANVLTAATEAEAQEQLVRTRRRRAARLVETGRALTDDEADALLASPRGLHLQHMMQYTTAGTADQVVEYLETFTKHADADEVIVAHAAPTIDERLVSVRLLGEAIASPGR
jgi:luciferase family oxidoreductase group 1